MANSIFLAKLVGPFIAILCIYFFQKDKSYLKLIDEVTKSQTIMLMFSIFNLAVGLLIINTHNIWVWSWPVLITLIGWSALLKGAVFLLAPNLTVELTKSVAISKTAYKVCIGLLLIIGLYLTFVGYTA